MDNQELLDKIEIKRAELVTIVSQNGLSSQTTIQYSQELDHLLNNYQPEKTYNRSKISC
ncbi:aspartyl-phosphate phosphatase Spo0E family protein [Pradoshia sp. D12]|uniref:aspartyl-phosphate phosphatase Spo0E family protein n=1 Tax=Bacillaceae TaxID=186817 RepID=UPI001124B8CD|nr:MULTISPECIES: aspartyl-phosphate phosphatase Spo0E family protein [Bacillaceae]QFK71333.1 aspartyl-phosphate phosphatase Spo0E family protein [Pradoshia sp. D12]TPF73128.1 aspartyl-phosphate phosphatase Spo0E family protein [Bacillus sp. D12]